MIHDVEQFLKEHYPFSRLPDSALGAISFHLIVRYYPSGEVIFEEGSKPLEYLYIVRKGAVSLEFDGREIDFLHEGDVFGYPSLLSGEPPTSTARVVQDAILYLLPKEIFLKLIEKYEEFELFFAKNLAKKLSATVKLVKTPVRDVGSLERFLTLRVKDIKVTPVPFLKGEENVLEAAKIMKEKNFSCVFVEGKETGIVTERDIIKRVVAEGRDPLETRLSEVMSYPVIHVDEESFLFEAIIEMANKNIRRIGVSSKGKLIGVLEDKDIIAYESKNLVVLIKEIEKARSVEDLRYVYSLIEDMVIDLFSEGLKVDYISRLISEINDKLMTRAVFLTIQELQMEPPVPFSVMVLGSEGRREQTLKTDQDNALIYDDTYPMLDVDVKEYFDRFGERYTAILIDIGFPPCPGNVMVANPEWRMGISEWERKLKSWLLKPEPEHTLKLGIFFDFRNAFGNKELVERLRRFVFKTLEGEDLFIAYMLLDAVRFKPPIGFMRRLVLETRGEHRGELDIKKGGVFPITQGVRALSLKGKVSETSTLGRIEKLRELSLLPSDLASDLREAYTFLQTLRLKNQIEKLREGKTPDNYVNPEKLSKLERDLLKDTLRIVEEFQSFIERRYTAHLPK
ncbi:CBS domain-containing protein [Hydrogenivirga caldilitoris]|uniref:CBS domain-containing protein n=1 Tax=Hydrogenivirga caldilitoris TaxID=246264 RepID=A0A497XQG7_9AQUI|nr:putative nucleotidyltransferase substrate binding domain-containing protein [Hydrogenivirga caldilitoris]RLJ71236.1 CBS domain-containing protein [Hydrogenivirga caldilitoris]